MNTGHHHDDESLIGGLLREAYAAPRPADPEGWTALRRDLIAGEEVRLWDGRVGRVATEQEYPDPGREAGQNNQVAVIVDGEPELVYYDYTMWVRAAPRYWVEQEIPGHSPTEWRRWHKSYPTAEAASRAVDRKDAGVHDCAIRIVRAQSWEDRGEVLDY